MKYLGKEVHESHFFFQKKNSCLPAQVGDKLKLEGDLDAVSNNRVNYPEHPVERPARVSLHKNSGNLELADPRMNPMAPDGTVSREVFSLPPGPAFHRQSYTRPEDVLKLEGEFDADSRVQVSGHQGGRPQRVSLHKNSGNLSYEGLDFDSGSENRRYFSQMHVSPRTAPIRQTSSLSRHQPRSASTSDLKSLNSFDYQAGFDVKRPAKVSPAFFFFFEKPYEVLKIFLPRKCRGFG